jgi:hypothetical protein
MPMAMHALALIAFRCAEYDATLMHEGVFKLYENASDNGTPLRKVLNGCAWRSLVARNDFQGVVSGVEARDYGGANAIVGD